MPSTSSDPLREPVELRDPDPRWAGRFALEAERLRRLIASARIEHIGSTAVPLRGKPIIDVQVVAEDSAAAVAACEAQGYVHHGEGAVPGRQYLTRREARPCNVHVFATGSELPDANLALRARLRADPPAGRRYVRAKEAALRSGSTDLLSYSAAKADCLRDLLAAPPAPATRIVGHDLPGRAFESARNVHVGVQRGREVIDLVPGDADSAVWEVHVAGLRGPYVHGRPRERFVYLSWGDLARDGTFTMFRRAKLHLPDPPPPEWRLALTDERGGPRCASVRF